MVLQIMDIWRNTNSLHLMLKFSFHLPHLSPLPLFLLSLRLVEFPRPLKILGLLWFLILWILGPVSGTVNFYLNWMGLLLLLSGCPKTPRSSSLCTWRKRVMDKKYIIGCFEVST
jgi:hypothetical protein